MKNVTITLDEEVARWARVRAAEQDTSLSRFVGETLRQQMLEEKTYEAAMERYLSRRPSRISEAGEYPRREELYDRPSLRR